MLPVNNDRENIRESTDAAEADSGRVKKVTQTGRFSIFSSIQSVAVYAFLIASVFTLFTPNNLFSGQMLERVFQAWQANPTTIAPLLQSIPGSQVNRIGIVAGHWKNDSGSVCDDGLTEVEVNLSVANLVQKKLDEEGFKVDLMAEFDNALSNYQGIALISLHSDTCQWISEDATGFKVAATVNTSSPEKASRLTTCLVDRYARVTGLTYLPNTVTNDMTYYHAFDEINADTTAAIIEMGFLNLDRQVLTQNPDQIAQGIVDGLICFIRNESVTQPLPTP